MCGDPEHGRRVFSQNRWSAKGLSSSSVCGSRLGSWSFPSSSTRSGHGGCVYVGDIVFRISCMKPEARRKVANFRVENSCFCCEVRNCHIVILLNSDILSEHELVAGRAGSEGCCLKVDVRRLLADLTFSCRQGLAHRAKVAQTAAANQDGLGRGTFPSTHLAALWQRSQT